MHWRLREIVNPANRDIRGALIREWAKRIREDAAHAVARRLPKRIVYWATITAIAHATQGRYGDTVVPELAAMDVLKRYGDDHRLHEAARW